MKAVIVTTRGYEHIFVTNKLIEALGDHLVGIVIEQGIKSGSSFSSIQKIVGRYSIFTVVERIITKTVRKILRFDHRQQVALKSVLGADTFEKIIPKDMQVLTPETVNKDEPVKWLENINPHLIFVYGTGIVGKRVLSLPSVHKLNLHTGISPYYRGSACSFWPLYNKDPLMIGSTVHICTSKVDGGDIYKRVSVRLSEGDDPFLAFAKSVRAGAKLYANIAKLMVEDLVVPSTKQDFSIGKEYLFKDKTFLQDIRMEYLIFSGKLNRMIKNSQNKPLPYPENGLDDQLSVK